MVCCAQCGTCVGMIVGPDLSVALLARERLRHAGKAVASDVCHAAARSRCNLQLGSSKPCKLVLGSSQVQQAIDGANFLASGDGRAQTEAWPFLPPDAIKAPDTCRLQTPAVVSRCAQELCEAPLNMCLRISCWVLDLTCRL